MASSAARTPTERSSIVHSSLYLPEPVHEALRKIAFDERIKIHDLVLSTGGYPRPQGHIDTHLTAASRPLLPKRPRSAGGSLVGGN
jgi:hypothetical protein